MKSANDEQDFAVHLYGEPIGVLHRRGNHTRFVFDSDYVENADRAVLGLIFEQDLITWACFDALGQKLGITQSLSEEVEKLVERVLGAWPTIAELFGEHPRIRAAIDASIKQGAQTLRKSRLSTP
jgi:hypothetical protein